MKNWALALLFITSLCCLYPAATLAESNHAELVVKELFSRPGPVPGIKDLKIAAARSGISTTALIQEMSRQLSDASRGKNLKHAYDLDSDFNPIQLQMGIEIEKEHTDDPNLAKVIAKAHLTEIPNYYDHLIKMEAQVEVLKKIKQRRTALGNFR